MQEAVLVKTNAFLQVRTLSERSCFGCCWLQELPGKTYYTTSSYYVAQNSRRGERERDPSTHQPKPFRFWTGKIVLNKPKPNLNTNTCLQLTATGVTQRSDVTKRRGFFVRCGSNNGTGGMPRQRHVLTCFGLRKRVVIESRWWNSKEEAVELCSYGNTNLLPRLSS